MKYLTRLLAMSRLRQLRKQWKVLRAWLAGLSHTDQQLLAALAFGEAQRVSRHPLPQFYAAQKVDAYSPWGNTVELAFAKLGQGERAQQMRGAATWLAVVFHETLDSPYEGQRALHREVAPALNQLRTLHERVLAIRMAA